MAWAWGSHVTAETTGELSVSKYVCLYVHICIYVYVCLCIYNYIYIQRDYTGTLPLVQVAIDTLSPEP